MQHKRPQFQFQHNPKPVPQLNRPQFQLQRNFRTKLHYNQFQFQQFGQFQSQRKLRRPRKRCQLGLLQQSPFNQLQILPRPNQSNDVGRAGRGNVQPPCGIHQLKFQLSQQQLQQNRRLQRLQPRLRQQQCDLLQFQQMPLAEFLLPPLQRHSQKPTCHYRAHRHNGADAAGLRNIRQPARPPPNSHQLQRKQPQARGNLPAPTLKQFQPQPSRFPHIRHPAPMCGQLLFNPASSIKQLRFQSRFLRISPPRAARPPEKPHQRQYRGGGRFQFQHRTFCQAQLQPPIQP